MNDRLATFSTVESGGRNFLLEGKAVYWPVAVLLVCLILRLVLEEDFPLWMIAFVVSMAWLFAKIFLSGKPAHYAQDHLESVFISDGVSPPSE